ncbi:hypothetical protein D9611_005365 [Ephemerocybe angulata]|uniref:Uncharacterized protein n=1 Tax=Ephemerocybe angulata TaxID=980116 RepID=A0A8H5C019_9AGAR|nr:hypothetical protein D9611_005365 [Tulosesus angulatus]
MVWIWEAEIWSIRRGLDSDGGRGIYKEDAPRFYSAFPPFLPHFPLSIAASSLRSHSPPALLIVLYTPPSSSPTATSPAHPPDPLPPSSSPPSHTTNSPYRKPLCHRVLARLLALITRSSRRSVYRPTRLLGCRSPTYTPRRFASVPSSFCFSSHHHHRLRLSSSTVVVGDVLGCVVVVIGDFEGVVQDFVLADSKRSRRTSSTTSSSASQSPSSSSALAVTIKTTVKWSRRRPILFLRPVVVVGAALEYTVVVVNVEVQRAGRRARRIRWEREGFEKVGEGWRGFQTTARWARAGELVEWSAVHAIALAVVGLRWEGGELVIVGGLLRDRDEVPGRGGRRMVRRRRVPARVPSSSLRAKVWAGVGFELNVSAFRCCVSVELGNSVLEDVWQTSSRLLRPCRRLEGCVLRGSRRRPAQPRKDSRL